MKEFKFSCPSCHQKIKVDVEFENRRVDCPVCKTSLIVPAAPKEEGTVPVATQVSPPAQSAPAATTPPTPAPAAPKPASPPPTAAPQPNVVPPKPAAPAPAPEAGGDKPFKPAMSAPAVTVPRISETRVAMLTPELKLEIVRAVRPRLADKSHWLPGKKEAGQYNYAARKEGDKLVPVSPTDASATHLSLFGAVLLEFHRYNIVHATEGRRKFLDEELGDAIKQVLGRQPGGVPVSEAERESLTHEQCLAVLDILEKRYRTKAEDVQQQETTRKADQVRLADLFKKMEANAPMRIEEVVGAVSYELEQIKLRLDKLERNAGNK